ncbi:TIGR02234 family membrane protein [Kineococcus sp. T13]|uniref:Trp biosynthesis-associated membrane protein n=1 Tax=Kineococcus vitellinus TaxID=2696565 RepID=UPI00141214F8|nr:TIGR02234 family membrane protein [Kineococcus vitellinus]
MSAARERGRLLLAGAAGAVAALAAGAPTWVSGAVQTATGTARVVADGRSAAPVATALALVGLAAVVAGALGRRVARALAAAVLLVAGVGVALSSAAVATSPQAALAAPARAASGRTEVQVDEEVRVRPWPLVSAAGGGLLALAGAGVLVRSRRWQQVPATSRYERGATRAGVRGAPSAPRAAEDPAAAWDSLTHGEDPTDPTDPPGPVGPVGPAR